MATFLLEIITPEKIAFQDQVDMVSVPSVTGVLGILPGHEPLFTRLTHGELKILRGKEESFYSLGEGFMEVSHEKVIITVTKALFADELDEEKLKKAKEEAEEALKNPVSDQEAENTRAMLRSILTDLKVSTRRKRRQIS